MESVNQTPPHCVNQMGKTHSKPLVTRHGRGTAWARHAMCESAFKVSWSFVFYNSLHFLVGLSQVLHIIVVPRIEISVACLGVIFKDSHLLLFKNSPSHFYFPEKPLKYFLGSIRESPLRNHWEKICTASGTRTECIGAA